MTLLFAGLLRSLIVAALAWLAWKAASRQSAALRHWILVGGLISSAAVMPLSLMVPQRGLLPPPALASRTSPSVDRAGVEPRASAPASLAAPRAAIPVGLIASVFWGAGTIVGLSLLAWRLARLAHLTRGAQPFRAGPWTTLAAEIARDYGITRPVSVRRTKARGILATWGFLRPTVLVPLSAEAWHPSWSRVVLAHELAHISRGDWAVQMAAEFVRALLWPNFVFSALCTCLRQESEAACDDLVVRGGMPPDLYATRLVDIARACSGAATVPALSMAGSSTLERRITMLLTSNRDRRLPPVWAVSLLMLLMMALGGATASFSLYAQAPAGRLSGHVYDPSGGVLPGVEVILEDERQVKWPTTTDSSGQFEFTPVGAGKYVLRATLPGFRTLADSFELRAASDWNRSVTLQVGELEETITVTEKRPSPRPAATATTASRGPVRIGGNIKPPVKLESTRPVYPAAMRDAGLEGLVPIEALIALDGSVASVRVLSAQVHPAFARAAEDAVRQWRFSQTLLNGVPVEVQMTVSVRFSLTD